MVDEKKINEWRKQRRQSVRALPAAIGFLATVCVVLLVVNVYATVPAWVTIVLAGIAAFSVIGDALNIAYLGWKLRRVGSR